MFSTSVPALSYRNRTNTTKFPNIITHGQVQRDEGALSYLSIQVRCINFQADVLVNAVNENLDMAAALPSAFHRAGGEELKEVSNCFLLPT